MRLLLSLRGSCRFVTIAVVGGVLTVFSLSRIVLWDTENPINLDSLYAWTKPSLLEQWKYKLGCDNTNLQVCRDKIQYILEKETIDQQHVQDRRTEARQRAQKNFDLYNSSFPPKHPTLVPIDEQYSPQPEWSRLLPAYEIAGWPSQEAATDHLLELLTRQFGLKAREPCLNLNAESRWEKAPITNELTDTKRQIQGHLFAHYQALASTLPKDDDDNTVHLCLNAQDVLLHLDYLHSNKPTTKYILLYRDPADWLWDSWNAHLDNGLYRSPELFHEMVLADTKTVEGVRWGALRHQSVTLAQQLIERVGRQQVLFVTYETMRDKPDLFVNQLAHFWGIERSKTKVPLWNDDKIVAPDETGNRPMLNATRTLVYLRFQRECQLWLESFGIEYPECIHAIDKDVALL